jgi:spore germination cell wall hydrolase CwlJ-like protein
MNEFKIRFSPEEIKCLQRNTYFEAATESRRGKLAVIMVVLNRVKSRHFPDTICDVVHQARMDDRGNPIRYKCQFSWYCDGLSDKPDLSRAYNKRVWDEIGELADDVVNNGGVDIVGNALFYHTKDVNPGWDNYVEYSEVDSHIFYVMNP